MKKLIRLNKYLSDRGIGSRRRCDQLIKEGKIYVDNHVVTNLGTQIDTQVNKVFLKNRRIISAYKTNRYFILNKPRGFLTTMHDPQGRPTIKELLPKIRERIYPVGRLDLQSQGIIILTNDGELAYRLAHPKFKIEKIYMVKVQSCITKSSCLKLKNGIYLKDGFVCAQKIKIKKYTKTNSWIIITITEGKNQIIRRMLKKLGFNVLKLKRVQFAFLRLDMLKPGEFRSLTPEEIEKLFKAVNLKYERNKANEY